MSPLLPNRKTMSDSFCLRRRICYYLLLVVSLTTVGSDFPRLPDQFGGVTDTRPRLEKVLTADFGLWFVAFNPDCSRVTASTRGGLFETWDVMKEAEVLTIPGHQAHLVATALSPDGRWLASGRRTKRPNQCPLRIWDARTSKEVFQLSGHPKGVQAMAFSPDSKWLCSGDADGSMRLWDVRTGKQVRELPKHEQGVVSITFNPRGDMVASSDGVGGIYLWTLAGRRVRTITAPAGEEKTFGFLVFNPDGRRLATVNREKGREVISIWDTATGCLLGTLRGQKDLLYPSFNSDGSWLAAADGRTVCIWDFHKREKLHTLVHDGDVYTAAFSPNGKRLASIVQESGRLYIWNCAPLEDK